MEKKRKKMSVTINEHSWYGKNIHLIRHDGRVFRGICNQLVIGDCMVCMIVQFKENGIYKKKTYSPILLLAMQYFWLNRDIVSEAECVDGNPAEQLPTLSLSETALQLITTDQKKAVSWMIKQVSLLTML